MTTYTNPHDPVFPTPPGATAIGLTKRELFVLMAWFRFGCPRSSCDIIDARNHADALIELLNKEAEK